MKKSEKKCESKVEKKIVIIIETFIKAFVLLDSFVILLDNKKSWKKWKKCESKIEKNVVIIIETLINMLLESDCLNQMAWFNEKWQTNKLSEWTVTPVTVHLLAEPAKPMTVSFNMLFLEVLHMENSVDKKSTNFFVTKV